MLISVCSKINKKYRAIAHAACIMGAGALLIIENGELANVGISKLANDFF
jgi:predicted cation transporter